MKGLLLKIYKIELIGKGRLSETGTAPVSILSVCDVVEKASYIAPRQKLNDETVREIKKLCARGELSQKTIGLLYGVTQTTICAIARGTSWKHVSLEEDER